MLCLFFNNIGEITFIYPYECKVLYQEVADACDLPPSEVKVYIGSASHLLLLSSGHTKKHNVHVYVQWYEGHSLGTKKRVAKAIQRFLIAIKLGGNSNIVFCDFSRGSSFFFEGELVP